MNLDALFRQTAHSHPTHPAIVGPGLAHITYAQLDQLIDAHAAQLIAAGVQRGDCVGLHVSSGADYIALNYAVWRCVGCVVPIPVELTAEEKQTIVSEISLRFVISEAKAAAFATPFVRGQGTELSSRWIALPVSSPREHPAGFHEVDAAFIRFTSGTTGASKGVVLSHQTIFERIHAANEVLQIGSQDRVMWLLSMSYHFAVSIVAYLSFGATIILPQNYFAPAVAGAIQQQQATLCYGSPTHYAWLAGYDDAPSLASLRLALSTTTSLDAVTARAFRGRFGLPITQALGIIEVGLPCINLDFADERPEAVGRVLPAYRLRMEDVGLGEALREVRFSGPGFLDAYYEPWQPRRQIMPDGWFRTGDVGQLVDGGCLVLRGRIKDVISVLGMKFFPQEVEAVLASHPRVASVCVLAQIDSRLGEVPIARVVPAVDGSQGCTADELLDFCRRRLADFKIPQRIEFVDSLPRTPSGKTLHRHVDP